MKKQVFKKNISLKVIVVIDGSDDGTLEMIQTQFPNVHYVLGNGDWWYTKSMNKGFEYAQKLNPDFILTMNDDIEITTDYINSIYDDFVSIGDKRSILGSLSITNDSQKKIIFAGIKKYERDGMRSIPYFKTSKTRFTNKIKGIQKTCELPGRGILIPNDILLELNFFDSKFIQYGSDTDFCFRARNKGINLLISWNAVVKVNTELTRIRSNTKNDTLSYFIKDLFDKHSHHSIKKFILFQTRHYNPINIIWKLPYYFLGNLVHFLSK